MKAKYVNEEVSFKRGQDPKRSMGIGLEGRLYKDLEKAGFDRDSVEISDDFVIYPTDSDYSIFADREEIKKICMKYMDPSKSDLAETLSTKYSSPEEIKKAVSEALDAGISPESIKLIIDKYSPGSHKDLAKIHLTKLTRDDKKEKFDEEYNTYVFIGYVDKVPVTINGKRYYEDKFVVENMLKIDQYNPDDLQMISGMKLRAQYQNYPEGGVYAVKVPKELMDEDRYTEIPENMQEIVEKYKFKI